MNAVTELCKSMLSDLESHHQNRRDALYKCIYNRLDKSSKSYISDLDDDIKYLRNHINRKLARKLFK